MYLQGLYLQLVDLCRCFLNFYRILKIAALSYFILSSIVFATSLAFDSSVEIINTTLSPAIEATILSIYKLSMDSAITCAAAVVVLTTTWFETGSTSSTKSSKAFLAI